MSILSTAILSSHRYISCAHKNVKWLFVICLQLKDSCCGYYFQLKRLFVSYFVRFYQQLKYTSSCSRREHISSISRPMGPKLPADRCSLTLNLLRLLQLYNYIQLMHAQHAWLAETCMHVGKCLVYKRVLSLRQMFYAVNSWSNEINWQVGGSKKFGALYFINNISFSSILCLICI